MEKSILVVFTGGTIGAIADQGVISVEKCKTYRLLDLYASHSKSHPGVQFTAIQPLNILSENCRPQHWSMIVQAIRSSDLTSYDGVIVTHGTDTLPYASSALSFTLTDVAIPIVLVSSDKPLEYPDSNGLENFSNAVSFIAKEGMRGVYVIYRNPDGKSYLHLGARLTSALPFIHSFRSEKDAFIAEVKNGQFCYNNNPLSVRPSALVAGRPSKLHASAIFSEEVLYLRPYPGLNYDYIDLSAKPKAILHDLYHSGTACTQIDDEYLNILRFVARCSDLGIPFYVSPIPGEGDIYDTCRDLVSVGVIALHDMAVEAALVKIMLAHGNEDKIGNAARFVQKTNVAFEFIEQMRLNNRMESNEE